MTPRSLPRFCTHCGAAFDSSTEFPHRCTCNHITYLNVPVASNLVVPVYSHQRRSLGVLMVRRSINPGYGKLGLPGGYVDHGETWVDGAYRELYEETGLILNPSFSPVKLLHVSHVRGFPTVVYGVVKSPIDESDIPSDWVDPESSERAVVYSPTETAFRGHTEVLKSFFSRTSLFNDTPLSIPKQGRISVYRSWWNQIPEVHIQL